MIDFLPDRRRLLAGALLAGLASSSAALAQAVRNAAAEQFVLIQGQRVLAILSNRALSSGARDASFGQLLDQLADFQRISGFVLGRYARQITPAQRQRFNAAFRGYAQKIFQSYMAGFRGTELRVTGSVVRGPTDTLVSTVVSGDGAPVTVAWRIMGTPGSFKAVDVQARGVWLAITLQQDFVSTIDNAGGDVNVLITRLESGSSR